MTPRTVGVVLAAGESARMYPANKLCAQIGGKPMVSYSLRNLREAKIERVFVVIGHDRARVKDAIGDSVEWVIQEDQLGTAHAAAQVGAYIDVDSTVVVIFGDCPFLDAGIIEKTLETHRDSAAELTIATARIRDPRSLGQVRRSANGLVAGIVDGRVVHLQSAVSAEIFAGLSIWNAQTYKEVLPLLQFTQLPNGRKEQNLPDAVEYLANAGRRVASYSDVPEHDAIAPNDPVEFDSADAYLRSKTRTRLSAAGVEIDDRQTVAVDYDVKVGPGTSIRRNVHLLGSTVIGRNCEIGPDVTLRNCDVGDGCRITRGSWADQRFRSESVASDKLAADHRYFRDPHFLIPEDARSCFVVMPFREPYLSVLANVIRPTLEQFGLECRTADRFAPGAIADEIWRGINRARIVIAECSEDNPNVWYEVGIAHALSKLVILVRRGDRKLPFDIAHQRVLMYDPDKANLGSLLEQWLAEQVGAERRVRKGNKQAPQA